MNNDRRKRIRALILDLESGMYDLTEVDALLQMLLSEEEEALDNIPESLQGSERYDIAEESVELLQEAIDAIDPDEDCADDIIAVLSNINGI